MRISDRTWSNNCDDQDERHQSHVSPAEQLRGDVDIEEVAGRSQSLQESGYVELRNFEASRQQSRFQAERTGRHKVSPRDQRFPEAANEGRKTSVAQFATHKLCGNPSEFPQEIRKTLAIRWAQCSKRSSQSDSLSGPSLKTCPRCSQVIIENMEDRLSETELEELLQLISRTVPPLEEEENPEEEPAPDPLDN